MPVYPIRHGGEENGGTVQFMRQLPTQNLRQWDWAPTFMWEARLSYRDLVGPGATQQVLIDIPAAGFVTGRITATFAGYGLLAPVDVTADAAVGETENDLATTLADNINTAAAAALAGVVDLADDVTNTVLVTFEQGIPAGTVSVVYRPAQLTTATFSGPLVDGDYALTFGGAVAPDVVVTTTRAAGVPATVTDMGAAADADISGEAGLVGFVAQVTNSVGEVSIQFEPDVDAVTVASAISPNNTQATFGGTETDGNYVLTFDHPTLPAPVPVTVVRVGGVPATNNDLAAAMETAVEANPQLAALVASANATANVNDVTTFPGVQGLTITPSAPAPGTLTVDPLEYTVADATPAGPVPTVTASSMVDMGQVPGNSPFPEKVLRHLVAIEVTGVWPAGTTIQGGTDTDTDALIGRSPAIDGTAIGRSVAASNVAQYRSRYSGPDGPDGQLAPVVTVNTTGALPTSGLLFMQVDWSPHGSVNA
jgi:hypothetical protein